MVNRARSKAKPWSNPKRMYGRQIALAFSTAILVFLGSIVNSGLHAPLDEWKHGEAAPIHEKLVEVKEADRVNILLIGTDSRPGDRNGNADVLTLVSLDQTHHRIEMLSIPRDTKVTVADHKSIKINQSLQTGGVSSTIEIVERLICQPINYYALTHFDQLVEVIDALGGVKMHVAQRMRYNTGDTKWGKIDLYPGDQTLSGAQALAYVRFRHDALGDIGRIGRQQVFLKAVLENTKHPEVLAKVPLLLPKLWSAIDTNMSIFEVGDFARRLSKDVSYPVVHETLPGSFPDPDLRISNDQSFWIVNEEEAAYVTKQLLENGITVTNPVQDPQQTTHWKRPVTPMEHLVENHHIP